MKNLGRYQFVEELSVGYLGARWAARQAGVGDDAPLVAIRCLDASAEHAARDRLSEAAFWAMGVHLAAGAGATDVVADGPRIGVVGAFHAGETLRMLLARCRLRKSRVEAGVALRIASDLLGDLVLLAKAAASDPEAAEYAHGSVAPDSVLVGTDGTSQLLDVGIGAVASAMPPWCHTLERLAYDVPERCGTYASVDGSADVFAVGVLLWELIAGRPLFEGTTRDEVTDALLNRAIPRLDEVRTSGSVDAGLASLVACALEREPERRIENAAALLRGIEALDVPLATRDEVADFVKGTADRLARAVGRLSERPPAAMPLPPPPSGVLIAPDWVTQAIRASEPRAPSAEQRDAAVDQKAPAREVAVVDEAPTRDVEGSESLRAVARAGSEPPASETTAAAVRPEARAPQPRRTGRLLIGVAIAIVALLTLRLLWPLDAMPAPAASTPPAAAAPTAPAPTANAPTANAPTANAPTANAPAAPAPTVAPPTHADAPRAAEPTPTAPAIAAPVPEATTPAQPEPPPPAATPVRASAPTPPLVRPARRAKPKQPFVPNDI